MLTRLLEVECNFNNGIKALGATRLEVCIHIEGDAISTGFKLTRLQQGVDPTIRVSLTHC